MQFRLTVCICFALMLQVSSSLLSSSGEGTGSGSAVKYPGQDSLYTSVGLSQSSDVASVRGESWCPMALAWASKSLGGQQSLAPLSGCYEVWKYSGAMFVSFLAADARRVGQGGEKGEAASSHTASLKRERGIAGIGFQIGVGDLIALRKQRESPGQTINQVACFGWFLPCTRYLSHPMAQNQILLVKVKPSCT